jgi:hypothetical protein
LVPEEEWTFILTDLHITIDSGNQMHVLAWHLVSHVTSTSTGKENGAIRICTVKYVISDALKELLRTRSFKAEQQGKGEVKNNCIMYAHNMCEMVSLC